MLTLDTFLVVIQQVNKILAPPIRIWPEMIECMGGYDDDNYKRFVDKCVIAFKFLRNHSKYILNWFHLMIHAGVKDLPTNQAEKTLTKMYDKFLPHIKDQEIVEKEFSDLITASAKALFVRITEKFHVWAEYWK